MDPSLVAESRCSMAEQDNEVYDLGSSSSVPLRTKLKSLVLALAFNVHER